MSIPHFPDDPSNKLIPAICTDPARSEQERSVLREVWQWGRIRRQRIELPAMVWEKVLNESTAFCFVAGAAGSPVLTTMCHWVEEIHRSRADWPAAWKSLPEVPSLMLYVNPSCESAIPKTGESLALSLSFGAIPDPWFVLLQGFLSEDPGIYPRASLEANGLTFTGDQINEADYWVQGRVLAQNPAERSVEVLMAIDKVICGQPIDQFGSADTGITAQDIAASLQPFQGR